MGYKGILDANQLPEWAGFYVDYPKLKELLRVVAFILRQHSGDTPPDSGNEGQKPTYGTGGVSKKLVAEKTAEFLRELDYNITRAATLYSEELQHCLVRLESIRTKWPFTSPSTLPSLYQECKDLVERVRDILIFLEVNAEAVRRILQKAEKLTQHELFVTNEILKSRLRPDNSDSQFNTLRIHSGTNILMSELRRRLDALRFAEHVWLMAGVISPNYIKRVHQRRNTEALVLQLYSVAQRTAAETKWYYTLANEAEIDYEAQPLGKATKWGLFLNNFNTFLYMTNYYLVIPTAGEYAEALGLSPAVSGVMLAMTPLAALFASALYSGWSSWSFRQPLMFCNIVLIVGNLLYGMAYDYKKIWMLFVGRLLVGIGGNRAVNRRYISDFVDMSQKNVQSAIFVAVGSLGMSLGPGIQTVVNYMPETTYNGFTFNKLTMSSWAMVALWIGFATLTTLFFTEPVKRVAVGQSSLLQPLLQSSPNVELPLAVTQAVSSQMRRQSVVATDEPIGDIEANDEPKVPKRPIPGNKTLFADTKGAIVCLWVYFVLKFVQEAFQTAAPLITAVLFGWSDFQVATLLAIIGLVVLPANLTVGWVGRLLPDRVSQSIAIIGLAGGCLWGLQLKSTPMSHNQYVGAGLVLFVSAQMLEAINMGLLSKVMPKMFATGLWNSGFLSTEAGTLGRMCGAGLVTVFGVGLGTLALQNAMGVTSLLLIVSSLVSVTMNWDSLLPVSERMSLQRTDPDTHDIIQCSVGDETALLRPLCMAPSVVQHARDTFMSVGGGGKLDDFYSLVPHGHPGTSLNIKQNIFNSLNRLTSFRKRGGKARDISKKKRRDSSSSSSDGKDAGSNLPRGEQNIMGEIYEDQESNELSWNAHNAGERLDSIESLQTDQELGEEYATSDEEGLLKREASPSDVQRLEIDPATSFHASSSRNSKDREMENERSPILEANTRASRELSQKIRSLRDETEVQQSPRPIYTPSSLSGHTGEELAQASSEHLNSEEVELSHRLR